MRFVSAGGMVRRAGVLALVLSLGACAPAVKLPTLPDKVPEQWRTMPAPTDAALGPAPDLRTWWHAFNDPTLDRLIERALAQNLNVEQAQLRLRGARALQHRASTKFDPQVSFHTFAEPDPNGSTSYFEIGFDALWEFGFFGRGLANERIAAADALTAETDLVAARVSVTAEVARSYSDLRAAQARAAVLDEIVAVRREKIRLAETLLSLRLGTQAEVYRAQAEVAQAIADASEPQPAIVQAQEALSVLLAQDTPDADITATGPPLRLPPLAVAQTPADLLRTRPEIRRAELNVLRAAGELGLARADLYPKLALGGSLTSSTRMVGDIDHPNKAIPAFGPVIDFPIFDWGARHDLFDARDAALSAAVLAYRQSVLEGVGEAESALAQLQRQQQRLRGNQDVVTALEHAAGSTRHLQEFGLADNAEIATAGVAAAQARLEQTQATHELNLAFIALYKSFGGALPPLQPEAP
jgi:NodT family efflux transporter outer membrane factor (OMF) lipoprotein